MGRFDQLSEFRFREDCHAFFLCLSRGDRRASGGHGQPNTGNLGRYDIYELTMTNTATYANPWEDPVITAVFTAPSGDDQHRRRILFCHEHLETAVRAEASRCLDVDPQLY